MSLQTGKHFAGKDWGRREAPWLKQTENHCEMRNRCPPPSSLVCLSREEDQGGWKECPGRDSLRGKRTVSQGSCPQEGRPEVPLCPFAACALASRCSSLSHSLVMYLELEMVYRLSSPRNTFTSTETGAPKAKGLTSSPAPWCGAPLLEALPAAASCGSGPTQRPQGRAAAPRLAACRGGAQRALQAPGRKARNMPVD